MTFRALMVMRMKPENAGPVADIFAKHDQEDEMPHFMGLTRRTLFRHHDLYMHLIEADTNVLPRLYEARKRPDFNDVNTQLAGYLERYRPEQWTELSDSIATPFYTWSPDQGVDTQGWWSG
ncbi:TcmI family type II polyketide cyclase [Flindersiella endophytica]